MTGGHRVVWQAAAVCLGYPDESTLARGPLVRRALAETAPPAAAQFTALLAAWSGTALPDLQAAYVDTFDLSGKRSLYLTYWTDGDTRRRGSSLATIKQRYRASGHLVHTHGELPDFLPLMLEYAARVDPVDGAALLQEHRAGLELLRLALVERRSPYAGVLAAVCATLPGTSPADRREVLARARSGPAVEQVGLEPYDPRLLPVLGGR